MIVLNWKIQRSRILFPKWGKYIFVKIENVENAIVADFSLDQKESSSWILKLDVFFSVVLQLFFFIFC